MNLKEIMNLCVESSDKDFYTVETLYKNRNFLPVCFSYILQSQIIIKK